MAVKKYDEAATFIKDNMKCFSEKPGKVVYQLNKEPYVKFLGTKGITKDTVKQMSDATSEYMNGSIVVAKDMLLKHKDEARVTLRTRTPTGRLDAAVTRTAKSRNPESGAEILRHGTVALRMRLKSVMDKDLLADCAAEVKKSV